MIAVQALAGAARFRELVAVPIFQAVMPAQSNPGKAFGIDT
jgi:hypothetical protein